jgi:hypothetical protein
MQPSDKHTCNIRWKKTDETLRTGAYNIRVQPLLHMQHPDLLSQHPYETLAIYLKIFETLETYACNMRFSLFFRTTQRKPGDGRFWPAGT